jgi:hypothetical protein
VQAKAPNLVPLMQSLINDATLREVAIRSLAAFDDPDTPKIIVRNYAKLSGPERAAAIDTLASRANYGVVLLEAVKEGLVPARDISPFAARQIQALKDPRIPTLLATALGEIRAVSADKAALMAHYKKLFTPEALRNADRSHGRLLFNRTCAACHIL